MNPLSEWLYFYEVLGAAAAALTGLQFITIAVIADLPMTGNDEGATNAFATPTIVHFSLVLLLAGFACAPWHGIGEAALAWSLLGIGGLIYNGVVAVRMQQQSAYKPVLEDWLFHAILPGLAYAALPVIALFAKQHTRPALFAVGGTAFGLLFIGIHNSWDNVNYIVMQLRKERKKQRTTHKG